MGSATGERNGSRGSRGVEVKEMVRGGRGASGRRRDVMYYYTNTQSLSSFDFITIIFIALNSK